jgi:hypothetical protein
MKEFLYILIVMYSGTDPSTGITTSVELKFDGFKTMDDCFQAGMIIQTEVNAQSNNLRSLNWYCDNQSITANK